MIRDIIKKILLDKQELSPSEKQELLFYFEMNEINQNVKTFSREWNQVISQWDNTLHDPSLLTISHWGAINSPEITFTVSDIHLVGTKLFVLSSTYSYYYEITTGVWTTLPSMNTPNCAVSIGTDLYIGAFHSVYKLDTTNDTLTEIAVVSNSGEPAQERVWRMAVIGTTLYVVGVFDSIDGVVAGSMAQYNTLTDTWTAWAGGLVGTIQSLLASGSNIIIGGTFTEIDTVAVTNVALWNGSAITAMSTGLNGSVLTLAVYGSNILAGGSFTSSISEWDGTSWAVFGGGITGGVSGIAVYLADVYVVGAFTDKGNYVAKYSGGLWSALEEGVNASATEIALYGQDVYIAGNFTEAGGKPAIKVAAFFNTFDSLINFLETSNTFNMGEAIHNAPAAALTDASEETFWDAVTNKLRKITWANKKATLLNNTSDTQVLYNNAGVLDGNEEFIYDDTGQIISLGKTGGNEASHIFSWATAGVSFHNLLSWGTGVYSSIRGISARGSKAAPTALQEDDVAMRYRGSAYDGVGLVANSATGGELRFVANENQSATNHGMRAEMWITPNGSTTEEKLTSFDEYGIKLVFRIVNKTGSQLNSGQVVYINGAQGNRPTVALAKSDAESTSHGVLGVVVDNIANNAEGYIQTYGVLPYDTSGFVAGNELFLSAATAGLLTNTPVTAPNHNTYIASALNATVNGKIFIRPQSGFESSELHDFLLTSVANDDVLQRKSGNWVNRTIAQLVTDIRTVLDSIYAAINGSTTEIFYAAFNSHLKGVVNAETLQKQTFLAFGTTGTSTAYTMFTEPNPHVALTPKEKWTVLFHTTAGANPTLNRDSRGAIALKYYDNTGTKVACGPDTIIANMYSDVLYDSTDYVVLSPIVDRTPPGTIRAFGGSSAPAGNVLCDGASLLRADYANLFAVIGTTYGAADGTHFNVPNLKGKVIVGLNSSETEFDALGETGGTKTHTLATSEMPSHTHAEQYNNAALASGPGAYLGGMGTGGAANTTASELTAATGGGGAHQNLQPYIVLNYIIKI